MHRYFLKAYALDVELELAESSDKADIEKAMQNQILAKGELIGKYSKS